MKKILDVTCRSRTIWFDKHHPAVVYCDKRREKYYHIIAIDKTLRWYDCVIRDYTEHQKRFAEI